MPVNTAVNTKTAPTVVLPSGFSFDTSNHAKKISKLGKTSFPQPSRQMTMIGNTTLSAAFGKGFTHKGVKSSKQGDK